MTLEQIKIDLEKAQETIAFKHPSNCIERLASYVPELLLTEQKLKLLQQNIEEMLKIMREGE